MGNLWHDLPAGPAVPERVYVLVEVPKGTQNKYEYSKDGGVFKLDRVLYSPFHYPGDYGFIPRTYFGDGDPLDAIVLMGDATFPGCVIEARPVGMLKMIDGGDQDYKVLCVPAKDPAYAEVQDLSDLPAHLPRTIEHFFTTYKTLENKTVTTEGWVGAAETKATISEALRLYAADFPDTQAVADEL